MMGYWRTISFNPSFRETQTSRVERRTRRWTASTKSDQRRLGLWTKETKPIPRRSLHIIQQKSPSLTWEKKQRPNTLQETPCLIKTQQVSEIQVKVSQVNRVKKKTTSGRLVVEKHRTVSENTRGGEVVGQTPAKTHDSFVSRLVSFGPIRRQPFLLRFKFCFLVQGLAVGVDLPRGTDTETGLPERSRFRVLKPNLSFFQRGLC